MSSSEAAFDGAIFPQTSLLFRDNAYQRSAKARVLAVVNGMLVLDQTLFYAASGGQPSDHGTITLAGGEAIRIGDAKFLDSAKARIGHVLPMAAPTLREGDMVELTLDWDRRLRLMRMHSALHLLSVALPYPVTGGAIGTEDGRLDFDIPDAGLEKEQLTAALNALIARNAPITDRMISEDELDANPALVKTLSVKPPRGAGMVRLVEIEGIDLQPCGGTHVAKTSEIGPMLVTAIEKKGKQNRRVRIAFA